MPWIRFGQFELNGETYELRKEGALVKIQQQPARVLALLVSNAAALITRGQIRDAIWGSETYVDFEQNLNFCIRQIRRTLNDNVNNPTYIETLPRLGYRFIAPVSHVNESIAGPDKPRIRLGVLPIEDFGKAVDDYFTFGLTEDLIAALSRVNSEKLRVVDCTRLRSRLHLQTAAAEDEMERVQRDFNLDYLLHGSVRRSAGAIRVCAQLEDLHDRSVLWSEIYDRPASDLPALQEELARRVSRSLALEILPADHIGARKYARSPAAYDSYLKGRYFWHKMTSEGIQRSLHYFNEAIALDSECAPAYAGLADSYAQMGTLRVPMMRSQDALAKAKPLVERAMQIDNTLAEAHCTLALLKSWYELDWAGAQQEFRIALSLAPNNITALLWQSVLLSALGRDEEAIANVQRAFESDPVSPVVNTYLGVARMHAGQFDLGIRHLKQAIELDPYYYRAYMFLGKSLSWLDREADAMEAYENSLSLNPEGLESLAFMAEAMASLGDHAGARNILARLKAAGRHYEPALLIASIHSSLGETSEMFYWMQRALEGKCGPLYIVPISKSFRRYVSDPRYAAFMSSIGLPTERKSRLLPQYSD
jgi:TolB-like protein/Tfp pilus assembly protein PilF